MPALRHRHRHHSMNNKIVIINVHGFQVLHTATAASSTHSPFSRNNDGIIFNLLVMHTPCGMSWWRVCVVMPKNRRFVSQSRRLKGKYVFHFIHFFHYTSYESIKYSEKLAKVFAKDATSHHHLHRCDPRTDSRTHQICDSPYTRSCRLGRGDEDRRESHKWFR